MEAPADLGPQIDPNTIRVGDIVYFNDFGIYKKVRITRRRDANDPPYFWLNATEVGKPDQYPYTRLLGFDPAYKWFPPYPSYRPNEFFAIRDSAQIQAQTNSLRNLGTKGKVPMDIAMHVLPKYLGLGGTRRRGRRLVSRSSKKNSCRKSTRRK
jgi:hypothetical protein